MILHVLLACSGGTVQTLPVIEGPKPDVVLVTLDTTRADRIGAYGYQGAQTDTIDRLAREGLRFERATSPLPLTIPAHSTMFTGLLPFHHQVRGNGDNVLAPSFLTLAEILKGQGYSTAASVAAFVTNRQWGLNQGFDAYFDTLPEGDDKDRNYWHGERSGDLVVDDALSWLAGQPGDEPVFLWVHLYDAHFPYHLQGTYAETMKDRPYDGELAFVDDQIARLVDAFEGRNVVWSLIGDHGEGLGDHDEISHGMYTYDATQHVPWILSGAGIPSGTVKEPVSTADLTPTLLHLLGVPIPDGLDGKPQPGSPTVPYAEAYTLVDRFRLAPHRAVISGDLKLIATPKPELYDLAKDPGEKENLAEKRPEDVARLRALLDGMNATPPTASAPLDAETLNQLAALGYMSGGGGSDVDPLTLPDPKDYAALLKGANELERDKPGGPSAVLEKIDALLAMKNDAFELRMRRMQLLARLGRGEEARTFAEETAEMFPKNARTWVLLASMAMNDGALDQGLAYALKAVEVAPTEPSAHESLVEAYFRAGRTEEALAAADGAMKLDAKNYGVAALLGRHYMSAGDFVNAEKNLRLAISGPNPRRAARAQLALLAVAAGARADAYNLLEAEVRDYPGNQMARRMLAKLYGEDQRWLDQREHLGFLLRLRPNDPQAIRAMAQCLFNLQDYVGARSVLDQALALVPDDPDVLLLHANLLAKEGKREEGLAVLAKANEANNARVAAQQAAAKEAGKDAGKGAKPEGKAPKGEKTAPAPDAPKPGAKKDTPAKKTEDAKPTGTKPTAPPKPEKTP